MSETPPPAAAPAPLSEADEKLWSAMAHAGTILFGFVPALIIWLVQKAKSAFVETEAKEALNFAIVSSIAQIVNWVIGSILITVTLGFWFPVALLIGFAIWVVTLIFCIQGAIKTNKGEHYRYTFNWRIVK